MSAQVWLAIRGDHREETNLLDRVQDWRDNLPASLANSATAEALDAVLGCAVMSKSFTRSNCQRASDGTDGTPIGALHNTLWQSK